MPWKKLKAQRVTRRHTCSNRGDYIRQKEGEQLIRFEKGYGDNPAINIFCNVRTATIDPSSVSLSRMYCI